jgi:DNA polymerase-3 subunit beta
MKFTVNSTDLQKALTKISGAVPTKSTVPILENLLFSLSKNVLHVIATDLEISMSATFEVNGSEDGAIAVPARRLMDTIRALPDIQIFFHADTASNKVKMITETGEYNLIGESSKEFPATPDFKADNEITLDPALLSGLIGRTIFSVSTDELRPAMTGVLLQFREGDMKAVATDGHRLVRVHYLALKESRVQRDIIIPAKALHLVSKMVEDDKCTLAVSASHIRFGFKSFTLTSRVIGESYPNYESVIPLDNEKRLRVNRNALLSCVRRVSLYSNSTTHQIRFSAKKNELKLSAEDVDFGGEARERIACTYDSDDLEIGFNSHYVVDILSHIDTEEVEFKFSSSVRAAIITPGVAREHEDVLMLVMPMRLNG